MAGEKLPDAKEEQILFSHFVCATVAGRFAIPIGSGAAPGCFLPRQRLIISRIAAMLCFRDRRPGMRPSSVKADP